MRRMWIRKSSSYSVSQTMDQSLHSDWKNANINGDDYPLSSWHSCHLQKRVICMQNFSRRKLLWRHFENINVNVCFCQFVIEIANYFYFSCILCWQIIWMYHDLIGTQELLVIVSEYFTYSPTKIAINLNLVDDPSFLCKSIK